MGENHSHPNNHHIQRRKRIERHLVNETPRTVARENIANLIAIPRKFKMAVDPTDPLNPHFLPIEPSDDYTKDELIFAIGVAMPEIATYVREMDELRLNYVSACGAISEMHRIVTGGSTEPLRGVIEDVEHLWNMYSKMKDFIHNAANNLPKERIPDAIREFNEKFLVNENLTVLPDPDGDRNPPPVPLA